jgi:hypothetical protein
MMFIPQPSFQQRSGQPGNAGTIDLKILLKSSDEKLFLLTVMNMFMPVTKTILAMGIGNGKF